MLQSHDFFLENPALLSSVNPEGRLDELIIEYERITKNNINKFGFSGTFELLEDLIYEIRTEIVDQAESVKSIVDDNSLGIRNTALYEGNKLLAEIHELWLHIYTETVNKFSLIDLELSAQEGFQKLTFLELKRMIETFPGSHYVIGFIESSLYFDFMLSAYFYDKAGKITIKKALKQNLLREIRRAFENHAAYSHKAGFWDIDNAPKSKLLTNISITVGIIEAEHSELQELNLNELESLPA